MSDAKRLTKIKPQRVKTVKSSKVVWTQPKPKVDGGGFLSNDGQNEILLTSSRIELKPEDKERLLKIYLAEQAFFMSAGWLRLVFGKILNDILSNNPSMSRKGVVREAATITSYSEDRIGNMMRCAARWEIYSKREIDVALREAPADAKLKSDLVVMPLAPFVSPKMLETHPEAQEEALKAIDEAELTATAAKRQMNEEDVRGAIEANPVLGALKQSKPRTISLCKALLKAAEILESVKDQVLPGMSISDADGSESETGSALDSILHIAKAIDGFVNVDGQSELPEEAIPAPQPEPPTETPETASAAATVGSAEPTAAPAEPAMAASSASTGAAMLMASVKIVKAMKLIPETSVPIKDHFALAVAAPASDAADLAEGGAL